MLAWENLMKPLFWLVIPVVFLCTSVLASADNKPPITQEDLKATSEPLAPGATAIILYRQVDRDDSGTAGFENNFVRIKILKEEGRKYADIEIPYYKESGGQIAHVSGRTIHSDGSVSEF